MVCAAGAQHRVFDSNVSATWAECIDRYQKLDSLYDSAQLLVVGGTDIGKPLHLFVINSDKVFYPELFDRNKVIVLINNSIHPGEPDGMDASILFCEEFLAGKLPELDEVMEEVILCIVPVYNIDGALNRNSYSRANQNGPEAYGFRGNGRNLDLNRDFIKCDSENAKSFNQFFTSVRPHVFLDTHVSNGADYQHTMTLISTQTNKLGGPLGTYMRSTMMPALFKGMEERGQKMCPYVNTMGRLPESGLVDFLESPRFASGYAALFNSIGFITETLMLKPFPERVESTWQFIHTLLAVCAESCDEIIEQRAKADRYVLEQSSFYLSWELDTLKKELFPFLGYEAEEVTSTFSNSKRIAYNRSKPFEKPIDYYSTYNGKNSVEAPQYYIVPQAWKEVVERLEWNGVKMRRIEKDSNLNVDYYYIESYNSPERPYEGHFIHSNVKTRIASGSITFFQGDYIIPLNQLAKRYIIEVLEPSGPDSFFSWNFFDSILQQKEWFSDYVFEDIAIQLLQDNLELKKDFDSALNKDESLKNSRWNQLFWIYQHSPYYENSANRYPVYRYSPIGK